MATYVPAKRATEFIFYPSLFSQSTGQIQGTPTLAAGDVIISKDGGAFANLTTLPTVTPAAGKAVKVTVSATEMTADNVKIVFSDAAGAEWNDATFNIQTAARQIDDLAYPATSGRSLVVDAAGLADANVVKVGPTGSGTAQTARDIGGTLGVAGAGLTAADDAVIAAIAALNNLSSAQVDTLLTTALPDSVPAVGTRPSMKQALLMLAQYGWFRDAVGTTMTVYKPDGVTALFTIGLNDADDPTSVIRAT